MNKLKAAVIGVGGIGRHHARNFREIPGTDLIGIADVDPVALARAAGGVDVPSFADYRAMLDEQTPDLVSIAVPTALHHEVAAECIARGIHVLVEKPIAATLEEANDLIHRANERGVLFTVGHIERFNPAVTEVKRRLDENQIGRVFQLHARRLSPFPARIQDVGVILDLAPHDIDIMRYLTGSEVTRLYAEVERRVHRSHEDLLSGLVRFDSGAVGVLDINWLTPTKIRQLQVLGEGGMYLLDYLTQDLYWYQNGDAPGGSWDAMALMRGVAEGDMIKVRINKKEPLRAELESFADAVTSGTPPLVSGADGRRALELAQQLISAGADHTVISVS